MIVEQRDYHVFTGKLPEVVRMYETEGIEIQRRYLGNFIGAFTTDVGALSTYTALWGYESYAERERRRAGAPSGPAQRTSSGAEPGWASTTDLTSRMISGVRSGDSSASGRRPSIAESSMETESWPLTRNSSKRWTDSTMNVGFSTPWSRRE